jgi:ribonuclease D
VTVPADSEPTDAPAPPAPAVDVLPPLPPVEPREAVPAVITDDDALRRYADLVAAGTGPLALDAERASGYRYGQRAYLVQVRREGAGTALIDPIAVPDLSPLQEATEGVEWILHAATQDLPCLAEVGLRPARLFDSELAGRLLGRERVSLAALVESELGLHLAKGHGATDWSVRPLSAAQLRYAALDVELLAELREVLLADLVATGKDAIAREEFDALLSFTPRDRGPDEWRRTSGIHRIRKPRSLGVVREMWLTRDEIARQRDIAPGRVLPDAAIAAAATAMPTSADALAGLPEFRGRGASRYLSRWWAAIARAEALPIDQLPGAAPRVSGPPPPRAWAERDPDAYARLSAARAGLADAADVIGMPAENLLTPDILRRLAWDPPDPVTDESIRAALQEAGARKWQVEQTLPVLVEALRQTAAKVPTSP